MTTAGKHDITGRETDRLCLVLRSGEMAALRLSDALVVKDAIEEQMKTLGLEPEGNLLSSLDSEIAAKILSKEEVKI